jgi:cobalt-zinc-cadmium efflux system protein
MGLPLILSSHGRDLNLRSAFLHLVGDAFTSLGVMVSGLVVFLFGFESADAIISILVSLWMAWQVFGIIRSTVNVLMEGTPESLRFSDVERALLRVPGVRGVHDLHIWSISSSDLALSAHVQIDDLAVSEAGNVLSSAKEMLAVSFHIGHATLELECLGGICAGSSCHLLSDNPAGAPSALAEG